MPAVPNLVAGGTIAPYRLVKSDTAAFGGLQADANALCIGVTDGSTNSVDSTTVHAASGEVIRLQESDNGLVRIEAGAAVTIGNRLKADANGKAVPVATTGTVNQESCGIALTAAAATAEIIEIIWLPQVIRPALV